MNLNRAFLYFLGVSAAVLAGCQSVDTTRPGAVGVDRNQRMMVSAEEVQASSSKAYSQMMAEAQKKGVLDRDAAQVQRVKGIVSRLVPQVVAFRPDARKWPWEVHVISVDEANAWCMPGGKMAVYTGLIPVAQNADAVAVVMGHEIAHALRVHDHSGFRTTIKPRRLNDFFRRNVRYFRSYFRRVFQRRFFGGFPIIGTIFDKFFVY